MFHIHWALETSLGREPVQSYSSAGRDRADCDGFPLTTGSQRETPIVCSHNTWTASTELSALNILERASGADISGQQTMKPSNTVANKKVIKL